MQPNTNLQSGLMAQPAQQREVSQALEVQIAAAAAESEARAEIESRIIHALRNPRDPEDCRKLLLDECRDPEFAEIALYRKPVGKQQNAQGQWEQAYAIDVSIRFIEAALQIWGNTFVHSKILADDIKGVTIRVSVEDVQRNLAFRTDAFIDRMQEKRSIPKGRTPRGTRENSYGETVFLLEATSEEMRNKVGSERSKQIRDNGKRILPRKLLVEARRFIEATLNDDAAKAPDAARKKILDRFASLGIMPSALKEYLELPIESLRPADLVQLGSIFNGLRDGDFTWPELLAMKHAKAEGEEEKPGAEQPQSKAASRSGKLKERILGVRPEGGGQQEPSPGAESETKPE